jgi:DNA-binding IclR family transcriptional regulator
MDVRTDDATSERARGPDRAFDILDFLRRRCDAANPNEIAALAGVFAFNGIVDSFMHCFAVAVQRCVATLCLVAAAADGLRNRDSYIQALKTAALSLDRSGMQSPRRPTGS